MTLNASGSCSLLQTDAVELDERRRQRGPPRRGHPRAHRVQARGRRRPALAPVPPASAAQGGAAAATAAARPAATSTTTGGATRRNSAAGMGWLGDFHFFATGGEVDIERMNSD